MVTALVETGLVETVQATDDGRGSRRVRARRVPGAAVFVTAPSTRSRATVTCGYSSPEYPGSSNVKPPAGDFL